MVSKKPEAPRSHVGISGTFVMSKNEADKFTPEETARRRDEAIRRALNTPPKPQKEIVGKSGRATRKRSRSVEKK
jgi:hypothetical protein